MFYDVHCHLEMCENPSEKIENAKKLGVSIITQGVNKKSNRESLKLAGENVYSALGLYPIDALSMSEEEIDAEIDFIRRNKNKIKAIGEIGLDLKESLELEKQKKIFGKLVNLAEELGKPMFIHSRKAELESIEMLEKLKASKVVMHCFSGKMSLVERIVKNGWMLSIPTNVVFSEHFQNVIKNVPIENLLCETDSPYLSPVKGERNEPANVIESYSKIASIKGLSVRDVEKIIENNWNKLL